jgi:glycosyltransferase involved in cell wall biosynthesis
MRNRFPTPMKNNPAGGRLRIAMVAYQFPPMFAGGARHALELAKALRPHGVESIFIVANLTKSPRHETYEGFPVTRFTPRGPSRIRFLTFALQVCKKLFAERTSIDIIHLHSVRPFYFLVLALAKVLKKPIVLCPTLIGHDDPMTLKKKPFLWQVEGRTYPYYGKIICKSTAMKESCERAGIPDALIASITGAIPGGDANGLFRPARDAEEIRRTREELHLPLESFIVTFVGHVQERKGCELLFDAWDELSKEQAFAAHLVLVGPYNPNGDGAFSSKLRAAIESAAAKRVVFMGQVSYAEVPKYLRASDCFVFPSKRESLGKAVIEAMATGLPVVCTRIPGVTEDIIDNGEDGIILDQRDAAVLAKAIVRVKEDGTFRKKLAANAVEKVRRKFSLADVAQRHLDLYDDLLYPAGQ